MNGKPDEADLLEEFIEHPSQESVFSWQKLLQKYPRQVVLGGLGLALIVFSALFLWRQFPPNPAVTVIPAQEGQKQAANQILVHVAGAVQKPGLYQLSSDARVNDALAAAGGLAEAANRAWFSQNVNLAQKVSDGVKLYVPFAQETGGVSNQGSGGLVMGSQSETVNINTASAAELEALSKIGPATAEKIISYREQHGRFTSVEELLQVPGIGEKTLEVLRNQISIF